MSETGAGGRAPDKSGENAEQVAAARQSMLARHKLIESMIHNNELQLKNESARGGAEIERECALRDAGKPGADAASLADLERVTVRLRGLDEEHKRLVAEREWLNASLLEFETGPSAHEHKRAGHS